MKAPVAKSSGATVDFIYTTRVRNLSCSLKVIACADLQGSEFVSQYTGTNYKKCGFA